MVHSVWHTDPKELLKDSESAICIGCRPAWSSFRPADLDTGSHSAATQCAQRAATREAQIKTSQGPRVCTSSVCWWGARRPLLLLYWHCVPFQSPPTISVSFITALDGSARASGVPGLQELGLSPPKGQWCCPKASSPSILQYAGNDGKTVQLWTSVPQKKRGAVVGSGSDNWGSKANLPDQNNSEWQLAGKLQRKVQWYLNRVGAIALRWLIEVVMTCAVHGTFRGDLKLQAKTKRTRSFFQELPRLIWQFGLAKVLILCVPDRTLWFYPCWWSPSISLKNSLVSVSEENFKEVRTSGLILLLLLWLETTTYFKDRW